MLESNKRFIQRFVDEVINAHNLAALDHFAAPDFLEHVPLPGQGPGLEGLRDAIGMFLAAFPDIYWQTEEQVAEGDTVVSRFTWAGTHEGPFLGIPPTGRRVLVWGVVIDVVQNGVLTQSRIIMDTLGLMQQLTSPPAAPKPA